MSNKPESESLDGTEASPLPHELDTAIPGTTYPAYNRQPTAGRVETLEGPIINGRATTIALYAPPKLMDVRLLCSVYELINHSFRVQHTRHQTIPMHVDRLQYPQQFLDQVGTDPGTFTYVGFYTGTFEAFATASAHRYIAPVVEVDQVAGRNIFSRVKAPGQGAGEYWELKIMGVDPSIQRQGLAGRLMKLCEDQIRRVASTSQSSERSNGVDAVDGSYVGTRIQEQPALYMVLTTVTESNYEFYSRRGYIKDYETYHPPGTLWSETGFHVVHMSKPIEDV